MALNPITFTTSNSGSTYSVSRGIPASSQSSPDDGSSSFPGDKVTLSQNGKDKAAEVESPVATPKTKNNNTIKSLDQQELEQLQQLKRRDMEVRAHEQAHLSAAGPYAKGGASFTYQKGADGALYAIGGEVGVDVTEESTPEATITKMETIKRAALAPASPSGADKMIAAQADAKEAQARQELQQVQEKGVVQKESAADSLSGNRAAGDNDGASGTTAFSSIAAKLAVYEKMAEA